MLPQYHFVAQSEHREWERRFNQRARRGDFVRRDLEPGISDESPRSRRLGRLVQGMRGVLSGPRVSRLAASDE